MPDKANFRILGRAAFAGLVAVALGGSLAACSKQEGTAAGESARGGAEERSAVKPARKTGPASQATETGRGDGSAEDAGEERMAEAVAGAAVAGKTAAAVDLRYDVPARPQVGRPIDVELSFSPRLPADSLEIEVTGTAGLTIAGDGRLSFAPVESGQRYAGRVQVTAGAPGLYYLAVIARMSSKVQSDARTFSVPLVVGTVAAAQKPQPARDASGEAIESLPAEETTTPRD